jgi:UDP-N-acetylmuramoylalanine--D-glutamate ligase
LDAFEKPVIIIAGGYDKNLPFDKFGEKIAEKAKAAILIGQTAPKISHAIKEHKSIRAKEHKGISEKTRETKIELVDSLPKAIQLANHLATLGDIVLLSPACASYDMFENYEQRGNEFTKLVKSLNK